MPSCTLFTPLKVVFPALMMVFKNSFFLLFFSQQFIPVSISMLQPFLFIREDILMRKVSVHSFWTNGRILHIVVKRIMGLQLLSLFVLFFLFHRFGEQKVLIFYLDPLSNYLLFKLSQIIYFISIISYKFLVTSLVYILWQWFAHQGVQLDYF